MKISMWIVIVVSLLVLFSVTRFDGQPSADAKDDLQLSEKVTSAVTGLLDLIRKSKYLYFAEEGDYHDKTVKDNEYAKSFNMQLDALAEIVDEDLVTRAAKLEEEDIRAKLIAIAVDRKKNRERYDEVVAYCDMSDVDPFVLGLYSVIHARPVSDKHLADEYRLVWEYLFLSPRELHISGFYGRPGEAMMKAKRDSSIVAITHILTLLCGEKILHKKNSAESFEYRLGMLNSFCNAKGLQAMLHCMKMAREKWSQAKKGDHQWDPETYVFNKLTDIGEFGRGKEWKKVIEQYPRETLSKDDNQFLDKVMKKLSDSK